MDHPRREAPPKTVAEKFEIISAFLKQSVELVSKWMRFH
jgi:hypothetical protein